MRGWIVCSALLLAAYGSAAFAQSPTWTTVYSATGASAIGFNQVIYAGGQYVAVGDTTDGHAAIVESTDGETWNSAYMSSSAAELGHVAYGNGIYVATSGTGLQLMDPIPAATWLWSADGVTWNAIPTPPQGDARTDIVYGNGRFVVMTLSSGAKAFISTSTDGQTWITAALPPDIGGVIGDYNLGFTGVRFVVLGLVFQAGSQDSPVFTSCDASKWTLSSVFSNPDGLVFNRIRRLSNGLVATGYFQQQVDSGGQFTYFTPATAVSPDGAAWTASKTNLTSQPDDTPLLDVALLDNTYYTGYLGQLLTSTDLIHWNSAAGVPSAASPNTLATNGSQIVAAGNSGNIIATPASAGATPGEPSQVCADLPAYSASSAGSGGGATAGTTGSSGGGGALNMIFFPILLTVARRRGRASRETKSRCS